VLQVQCNGTEVTLTVECPRSVSTPQCGVGAPYSDLDCELLKVTDQNMTCLCSFPNNGDNKFRRLQMIGNTTSLDDIVDTTITVSYGALMKTTLTSFTTTITSAKDLNVNVVKTGWQVMVTLGCFIGLALIGMLFSWRWDHNEAQVSLASKKVYPSKLIADSTETSTWRIRLESMRRTCSDALPFVTFLKPKTKVHLPPKSKTMVDMAEEALPRILSTKSVTTKIKEEMKFHHRWLGIIYLHNNRFPRMLRVVSLTTNIIIMLFVQSITYNLSHGDDGTCSGFVAEDACLTEPSAFDSSASKCYWEEESGSCNYVQPDNDVTVVIFVAILSAVISTPFAMVTDWMIQNVLAAPPLRRKGGNRTSAIAPQSLEKDSKIMNVVPGTVHNRTTLGTSLSSNHIQAEFEFSKMLQQLNAYRSDYLSANEEERKEFDGKSCFALFR
jgi:hypothetical protein